MKTLSEQLEEKVDEVLSLYGSLEEINEEKWSGKVETKWKPKEGFFKQSAEKIANGLHRNSKDLKTASSRLNFFINRAGTNLSKTDKSMLEHAKELLRKKFNKDK